MILRLAHVEITADDLGAARAFYVDLLGFREHLADGDALYLRASEEFDAWSLKVSRGSGGGLVHSGFRVSAESDLDALERIHRDLGVPVSRVEAGVEPGQGAALRVLAPTGHRIEFFHGFDEIDPYEAGRLRFPMRSTHAGGSPVARIDHVSQRVADVPAALGYWRDALDFSVSEMWVDEDDQPRVAWVRRTPLSHDVALGPSPQAAFHHFAYTVHDAAALLQAADLIGDARLQQRIEWGPSRHGATNALAMYVRDPAGNRLELYTGDYARDLDRPPLLWRPADYALQGHSWWGWPPPDVFHETLPLINRDWPTS
jgi:catechol 2,3-dioxygenase